MKSSQSSMSPFAFLLLFSLIWASLAHANDNFLNCLSSLHPEESSSISKVVYTPNNASYSSVLNSTIRNFRFATPTTPKPLVIVTPLNISHIQSTIHCSRKNGLEIRTRSGGHDFEGRSYVSEVPFVIVDLINLRSVDIDKENKVAWVQSGAIMGELYYKIANTSNTLAFPGSLCPTIGIGGYLSGGGYGLLFRQFGLAADNTIDALLIDVNGRVLDRKAMGEDVFWAIRGGGGGSFGIVIAWKLQLVSIPARVTVFRINRTLEQNVTKLLHRWQYVAPNLPDNFYFAITATRMNSSQDGKMTIVAYFYSLFLGGIDELLQIMQERFPELGLVREDCSETSWIESILFMNQLPNDDLSILLDRNFQNPLISPSFKVKSDYVQKPIPEIAYQGIWPKLFEEEAHTASVDFISYGGRMAEIPDTATPFPYRAGTLYKIIYNVGWQEEDNVRSQWYINWIRRLYSYMAPFVSKSPRGAFINYRDLDIGVNNKGKTSYAEANVWGSKYFMNNFKRLAYVKTMIDPENFFKHEQSIPLLVS